MKKITDKSKYTSDVMSNANNMNKILFVLFNAMIISVFICLITKTIGNSTLSILESTLISVEFPDIPYIHGLTSCIHLLAKAIAIVSFIEILTLSFISNNNTEYLKEKFEKININPSNKNGDYITFSNRIISFPNTALITDIPIFVPDVNMSEHFNVITSFRNICIASVDGDKLDYVYWEPDSTYSLFNISPITSLNSIANLLSEHGFIYIKTENSISYFKNQDYVIRIKKSFFTTQFELCSIYSDYSYLIPQYIEIDENIISKNFNDFVEEAMTYGFEKESIDLLNRYDTDLNSENTFFEHQITLSLKNKNEVPVSIFAGSILGEKIEYILISKEYIGLFFEKVENKLYNRKLFLKLWGLDSYNIKKISEEIQNRNFEILSEERKCKIFENDFCTVTIKTESANLWIEIKRREF